jgi:hypothetical protein
MERYEDPNGVEVDRSLFGQQPILPITRSPKFLPEQFNLVVENLWSLISIIISKICGFPTVDLFYMSCTLNA